MKPPVHRRLSLAIVGAGLLVSVLVPGVALAGDAGRVVKAEGGVSVLRGNKVENLKTGATLQSGDTLVTGVDGRVQWQTADESLAVLAPNSRFTINQYSYENGAAGEAQYELKSGAFGTISGLIQSPNYKLVTPAADVTVEGTKYKSALCRGNCKGLADGMYVAVVEGKVTVSNGAGSVTGSVGQYVYIASRNSAPVLLNGQPPIFLSLSAEFNFEFDPDGFADIIERPLSPS